MALTKTEERLVALLLSSTDYTEQMARETVLYVMRGTVDLGAVPTPEDTNITASGQRLDLEALEGQMAEAARRTPRPIDEVMAARRSVLGSEVPDPEAPPPNTHHLIFTGRPGVPES